MPAALNIQRIPPIDEHYKPTKRMTGTGYSVTMRNGVDLLSSSLACIFHKNRCDEKQTCSSPGKKDAKVRNIYRQPASARQRDVKPTMTSLSGTPSRRDQFVTHGRWHSDPGEIFHSSVTCTNRYSSSSNAEFFTTPDEDDDFRCRSQSLSTYPASILKKQTTARRRHMGTCMMRTARANIEKKQTTFKEDVAVCYYDETQQSSSFVYCGNLQKLKEDMQLNGAETSALDIQTRYLPTETDCEATEVEDDHVTSSQIFGQPDVIVAVDDNVSCRRRLRVTMTISQCCARKRTAVKVMSGGRTLVVMAYRMPTANQVIDWSSPLQHVRRIILPVAVDPYTVKACVHSSGNLTVEAPVCETRTRSASLAPKTRADDNQPL